MRRIAATALLAACLATPVATQTESEDAGGFLVDLLESNLSGENRNIQVIGLDGAFSSQASIEKIIVSDDQGVWLTITGAVLDWNRLALLRGRFSVDELSAERIEIARAPGTTTDPDLPAPEAAPFALPELPVAVEIEKLSVGAIELGTPLVGVAATVDLNGELSLADGALETALVVNRLDRQGDGLDLKASFANDTRVIGLDLKLVEAANGLIANTLNIPDAPPLVLTAVGEGPLDEFGADIALATDGVDRVNGSVALRGVSGDGGAGQDALGFAATLQGDVTPLMAQQYRSFFGANTDLDVKGSRLADGRLEIETLSLQSDALTLNGSVAIAASGQAERVILDGDITPPQGSEVVLPISGPPTAIRGARINANLDTGTSNNWTLDLIVDEVTRPDLSLRQAKITAGGMVMPEAGGTKLVGKVMAGLTGIAFSDENLQTAVGADVELDGGFETPGDGTLKLSEFQLDGSGYRARVDAQIDGLDSGFAVDGTAQVEADDLSRFAGLAGRPVSGSLSADLTGKGAPLGGSFDVVLKGLGRNLGSGVAQIDALMKGDTRLTLDAARDENGLDIRTLTIDGTAVDAKANGTVRTTGTTLDLDIRLDDLGRVVPQFPGPVRVTGAVQQSPSKAWTGNVRVDAPKNSFATLTGDVTPDGAIDVNFESELTRLERFVPQLPGTLKLRGDATQRDGAWAGTIRADGPNGSRADVIGSLAADGVIEVEADARLERLQRFVRQLPGALTLSAKARQVSGTWTGDARLEGPTGSVAKVSGEVNTGGDADVTFDAVLKRLERLVPEFPGQITAKGSARRSNGVWQIDSDATGPASIDARINGTYDEAAGTADATARGQVQLGAANRFITPVSIKGLANFDLALRGKPGLNAVSGRVSTAGTSIAIPQVQNTINNLRGAVTLSGGRAALDFTGNVRTGGGLRVSGPVALTAPFDGNIAVDLNNIVLTDDVVYSTSIGGRLTYTGPLAGNGQLGGRIDVGETEIDIGSASGGASVAAIPDITHVNEPGAVRATRSKAGLINTGKKDGGGPVIGLNIDISAPNRVFVRGRGLTAELGGNILVRGTTAQVSPSGQIGLIRGRLDILGRRLNLTKGLITLQGSLVPYLEFGATTNTDDGVATLEILGRPTDLEINVYSDPERPAEEALAMLLFGNQFSNLSPIKIAQLAASLNTLRGGGGGLNAKAREATGFDSIDLGEDASGAAAVGVGGYVSENVYTDVTINNQGKTELNLNLDVTDNLTIKGSVDNAGESGVGIFFERDY